jgi:hypothetical protein
MGLLAKQKILDKAQDMCYNEVEQTVWKLNIEIYTSRRERIIGRYVD